MWVRFVLGLLMTVVCLGIAGRRAFFLYRVGQKFQPLEAERRVDAGSAVRAEVAEVAFQRKLLRWTVPGVAHFLVFWGFMILLFTIVEAFIGLVKADFQIPIVGNFAWFGFIEDLFALLCVLALVVFTILRIQQAPKNLGRRSRFFGSHIGPAWFVLFMIFNVVWTLLAYRGASINAQELHDPANADKMGFLHGAFASQWFAAILPKTNVEFWETFFLLLSLGVLLGFTVFVTYSKHMHIFASIPNVAFARRPRALGALEPVFWQGKKIDFEDPGDDDVMGVGKVEDFTWKGLLDFATCTECGRCQSQCPAWNTDKPLSPKVLIMGLRDHSLAKAPYLLAAKNEAGEVPEGGIPEAAAAEAAKPLVGPQGDESAHVGEHGITGEGVIPFDMLWSCTTCGACVEQCPVDIEHVDHIVDMRRYQVLMEGAFPEEAGIMLNNVEHAGDPWGLGRSKRLEWAESLDFELRVYEGDKIPDDVEYLYWVGCAGALDDTAKRTARAVATLLHEAGVEFMVLGEAESCTGDPARRMGHEFLFQMLAMQNVEVLNEAGAKRIVVTCAHCYNTLANEYPQVGGHYEVVHHTTLLARLVADKRLTPVQRVDAAVTYHDPCYLGRHNRIFAAPREVLGAIPGTQVQEMPRNREKSFCCGAGGARMWMDENLGERINQNRADEALATKPDIVAAACPFCITMLSDGVAQRQQEGTAATTVAVTDVSEVLLRSVRPDLVDSLSASS
ncbi:MAG: (Fe-S)-binding protein [Actinomycetales bacterium]|jgi:Fe-S oxidoreductase|nr:(Fe-S)-binding protein [Candidatus Phosphoribacter baldrii]MBK6956435.1 (Fe-S)-binding protein [Candidatus Phosphoribacter baldrii]MBK7610061.1 (Fe-S)-binding protein [Candidatus Phosphoribacter baldrii]